MLASFLAVWCFGQPKVQEQLQLLHLLCAVMHNTYEAVEK
jgi:hypothetical protein